MSDTSSQSEQQEKKARGRRIPWLAVFLVTLAAGKLVLFVGAQLPVWAAPRDAAASARLDRSGPDRGRAQVRGLVEALQQRQTELRRRADALDEREEAMLVFERELDTRVADLEAIRTELEGKVGAAEEAQAAAAAEISRVYAAMKPAEAAPILDGLEDAVVLRILRQMRAKQVSAILPLLEKDRAVALTRALAG